MQGSLLKRIISDPKIMAGRPVFKGTEIPVSLILQKLAEGVAPDEILDQYPKLEKQDIKAAIEYSMVKGDKNRGRKAQPFQGRK